MDAYCDKKGLTDRCLGWFKQKSHRSVSETAMIQKAFEARENAKQMKVTVLQMQ